ncbi:MAG: hypothetical protein NTW19_14915 [Planctomycetota bacterium]|nr:hypothetical protein [Planctomycetota bacterium]
MTRTPGLIRLTQLLLLFSLALALSLAVAQPVHAEPLAGAAPDVIRASVDDTGTIRIPIECEDMHGVAWGPEGFTPTWTAGQWGRDLHQNMVFGAVWASRMAAAVCDASDTPAEATCEIEVPKDWRYKIWAEYECPPFFNYPFTIRIDKLGADGKPASKAFEKLFGLRGSPKHFSFSGKLQAGDLYWAWGMDHDAAEGYEADLSAGRYRVTLIKAALPAGYQGPKNPEGLPAREAVGARSVDAILITSQISDISGPQYPPPDTSYVSTHDWPIYRRELDVFPLLPELQRANHVYVRFKNTGDQPIVATYGHWNHRNAHAVYSMTSWSMRLVRFHDEAGAMLRDDKGAPLMAANGQWAKPIAPGERSPWIDIGPTMNPESNCPFTASAEGTPGTASGTAPAAKSDAKELGRPFTLDIALEPSEKAIIKSFDRVPAEPNLSVLIQPDLHRPQGKATTMRVMDVYREMTRQLETYPRVGPAPKKLRLYGDLAWIFGGWTVTPDRADVPVCLDYALALGLNTMPVAIPKPEVTERIKSHYAAKGTTLIEPSVRIQHTMAPDEVKKRISMADPANPKGAPIIDPAAQARLYIASLGDEIATPGWEGPKEKVAADFRAFLAAAGVKPEELGIATFDDVKPVSDGEFAAASAKAATQPATQPAATGDITRNRKRLFWWSHLFGIEQGIKKYAGITREMTAHVGPHFKTAANLGGMAPFYWMPQALFIEMFRGEGMTMAWSEDYDYCQPEASRLVVDFEVAYLRAGAKYHDTPIMFYAMPHFPGNTGQHLMQNTVMMWGQGVKDIDFFYVSPDAFAAENYIGFRGGVAETGKTVRRISGMAGNIEDQLLPARTRPAKVAMLISEASDLWETEGLGQWAVAPGSAATNASQEERKNIWYCLRM